MKAIALLSIVFFAQTVALGVEKSNANSIGIDLSSWLPEASGQIIGISRDLASSRMLYLKNAALKFPLGTAEVAVIETLCNGLSKIEVDAGCSYSIWRGEKNLSLVVTKKSGSGLYSLRTFWIFDQKSRLIDLYTSETVDDETASRKVNPRANR